jgi:hypothetical protein
MFAKEDAKQFKRGVKILPSLLKDDQIKIIEK